GALALVIIDLVFGGQALLELFVLLADWRYRRLNLSFELDIAQSGFWNHFAVRVQTVNFSLKRPVSFRITLDQLNRARFEFGYRHTLFLACANKPAAELAGAELAFIDCAHVRDHRPFLERPRLDLAFG